MNDKYHDDTWLGIERWLERSESILDAVDRRIERRPAVEPGRILDIWTADRDLLLDIMTNTPARTLRALRIKMRALQEPCEYDTGELADSIVQDLLTMEAA